MSYGSRGHCLTAVGRQRNPGMVALKQLRLPHIGVAVNMQECRATSWELLSCHRINHVWHHVMVLLDKRDGSKQLWGGVGKGERNDKCEP